MADLNKESLAFWNSIKPMIDEEIKNQTRGMVQRRRAKVTTAPSLATGLIGVTEPFVTEYFIPFNTNLSTASVGDQVWVEYMYGASNAFASMFASADTKNAVVGGTLDIVGRRAFATVSSDGWYRVCRYDNLAGPDGMFLKIYIGKSSTAGTLGECHEITLYVCYGFHFALENSITSSAGSQEIDKIRCTGENNSFYVDVHYNASSENIIRVDFQRFGAGDGKLLHPMGLESVDDSPSGETVFAVHDFIATGFNFTMPVYMNGTLLHS